MLELSNPRRHATVEDWPCGRRRVTAHFEVESNKRGSRVKRTTTGKPKATTYYRRMTIVDEDDGRTYLIGDTEYRQHVLIPGTLRDMRYFYADGDSAEFAQIGRLLDQQDEIDAADKLSRDVA